MARDVERGPCSSTHEPGCYPGFPQSKGSKRPNQKLQYLLLPNLQTSIIFSIGQTKLALIKCGRGPEYQEVGITGDSLEGWLYKLNVT